MAADHRAGPARRAAGPGYRAGRADAGARSPAGPGAGPNDLRARLHDLRTPLTVIRGYAELLLREGASPDAARRYAAIIERSHARLERLVGGLPAATGGSTGPAGGAEPPRRADERDPR